MNIKPLGDRVVVKPIVAEQVTVGGIVLPDTAKEKPQQGTVIAAGDGRIKEDGTTAPMPVKVGDKVLYAKFAGTELKENDDVYVILNAERDVLAIIED